MEDFIAVKNASRVSSCIAALLLSLVIAGCSIEKSGTEDKAGGKKVDIESPLGSLHVATNEKTKGEDTGLPVYPGARPAPEDRTDHDSQSANVSLGFAGFGLKVIARKYESDDSSDKLLSFYHKALEKYGQVMECKGDLDLHSGKEAEQMTCKPGSRDKTELGVYKGNVHHVVSVEPSGKGTKFALIYLQLQGRNRDTM